MSYGMDIWDSAGVLTYSSTDVTWNHIGSFTAPANTSITFTGVPQMTEHKVIRQMVNQLTSDDEAYIHTFTLLLGVLTCTAPDTSNTTTTLFTVLGR
jgi:hypothetical protein